MPPWLTRKLILYLVVFVSFVGGNIFLALLTINFLFWYPVYFVFMTIVVTGTVALILGTAVFILASVWHFGNESDFLINDADDREDNDEELLTNEEMRTKKYVPRRRGRCHVALLRHPKQKICILSLIGMDIACLILTGWFVARPLLNPHLDARVRILGSITHSEAKITFRNPRATSVYVEYWAVASHNTTLRTPQEHITNLTDYTVTIRLRNLTPSTTYFFRPVFSANSLMNGRENELHEELGNFTTLPPPLTPVDFSFSYGSCVIRSWTRNLEGFRSILQKNPNFALIIGDQIYSDNPVYFGPEKKYYEAKYREVLSDPYFAELAASKPLFHIFDDHELMNDWDKRQSPPYATAISTWQQYVGNKNPDSFRSSSTNNIYHYYAFYYGNVAFFVMDTRSFRSPNRMPDSAEKTMLGAEQLHDLKYWLLSTQNSTIVFRFLVTSVPFTLNTALGDSWSSFKTEREDILNFIVSNRLNNCIILSGDAHWAGVFKIREGLYEFSTSPLDAFAAPNLLKNIDEQLFFDNRSRHQGFIQVSTTSSPPFVKYMLYGTNDNEPLFNLTLTPSQLVVS